MIAIVPTTIPSQGAPAKNTPSTIDITPRASPSFAAEDASPVTFATSLVSLVSSTTSFLNLAGSSTTVSSGLTFSTVVAFLSFHSSIVIYTLPF